MTNLRSINYSYLKKISSKSIIKKLKKNKKMSDEFETQLFLSKNNKRKAEGGLRLKGYFKTNKNKAPLITIITVVFNNSIGLEETIKSVQNQSYKNLEHIIIDGGSTDTTLNVLIKYNNLLDLWVSEKDKGIYDAMNKGCRLALGEGLVFLNSGDKLIGDVFYSNIKLPCFIPCMVKNDKKIFFLRKITDETCGMPTSHQAMIFKNKRKLYNLSFKISSDYDYYIKNGCFSSLDINCKGYILYDNTGFSRKNWFRRDLETMKIIFKNFGLLKLLKFLIKKFFKLFKLI